jgi:RNA-binding protein with serine-rich domain 1
MNEQHLYEIFGQFGRIKDLDLPINRTCKINVSQFFGHQLMRVKVGTNRGTAYILYDYEDDAEAAIAHMHEAQVDGSAINVSIVLPRRKLSPAPPTARRGANIDPRVPFAGARGGPPGVGMGGNNSMGGGGRRRASPGSRYGPRSDVYRPGSRSPSRSSAGPPPSRGGGGSRYRSRSNNSFSSRSRSRSPGPRRKPAGRHDDHETRRRGSIDSHEGRSRSRSRGRGPK